MAAWFRQIYRLDVFASNVVNTAAIFVDTKNLQRSLSAIEPCQVSHFPAQGQMPDFWFGVSDSYVYLVVRGTSTPQEMANNFLFSAFTPFAGIPGIVHSYFGQVGVNIASVTRDVIAKVMPGRRLVGIGHSLGAAAVQTAIAKLGYKGNRLLLLSGCPRVGNDEFAASWELGSLYRVENTLDPVPHVPPPVWLGWGRFFPIALTLAPTFPVHGGVSVTIDRSGGMVGGSEYLDPESVAGMFLEEAWITPHLAKEYARRQRRRLPIGSLPDNLGGYVKASDLDQVMKPVLEGRGEWAYPISTVQPLPSYEPDYSWEGGGMNVWRYTMMFEAGEYGWSESYYRYADSASAVYLEGISLAQKRIALSGDGVAIPYHRVSQVDVFRDYGVKPLNIQSKPITVPENKTAVDTRADKPYSALLVQLCGPDANGPYRGRIFMRGVPDDQILGDDPINLTGAYMAAFYSYVMYLSSRSWYMRQQARFSPDLVGGKILSVSAGPPAVITTDQPHGLNVGDKVVIMGGKGIDPSTPLRGTYTVASPTTSTTFSIAGLTVAGTLTSPASWRKSVIVYKQIANATVLREVSHRTGRPFASPVGRRRRRKTA